MRALVPRKRRMARRVLRRRMTNMTFKAERNIPSNRPRAPRDWAGKALLGIQAGIFLGTKTVSGPDDKTKKPGARQDTRTSALKAMKGTKRRGRRPAFL